MTDQNIRNLPTNARGCISYHTSRVKGTHTTPDPCLVGPPMVLTKCTIPLMGADADPGSLNTGMPPSVVVHKWLHPLGWVAQGLQLSFSRLHHALSILYDDNEKVLRVARG